MAKVPDFFLDEWANAYQFYLVQEAMETGLGTYCILERDARIPNLIKEEENIDGLWSMFIYGSRNKNGSRASFMFISLELEKYYFSYGLQFSFTTNVAKDEALIQGLQLAQRRGIKPLKVYGDSELVVHQFKN